jgi:Tol biopolymer transport system component/predicted Ser/Thr protein kinase
MDLVDQRLGKYEIRAEIGRGGMGVVFLGYDPDLDRQVAVKVLAPHLVWETEFVERFLREARAAARLKHANIVTIYDVGQEGSWYYFVMECLEGQTLAEYIQERGPLPPEEVLSILRPLAEALDYAHEQGLVHRDIKPANIVIEPTGRVVLTDFGIARAAEETGLTRTGMFVGTPQYVSPEQARGEEVDYRTDIYSLGVVAYQMLSGQVPFDGKTPHSVLHKQIYEPPPPIRHVRPELPQAVDPILGRTLAKEAGQRYPTVTSSVETLAQALAGEVEVEAKPSVPVAGGVEAARARRRRRALPRRVWLLGGAVAVVLVLVVAAGVIALIAGGGGSNGQPPLTASARVMTEPTVTLQPTSTRPPTSAEPTPSVRSTAVALPTTVPNNVILYNVEDGDAYSLYSTDLEGNGPYLLASGAESVAGYVRPDGERVIVRLERNDRYTVYLMKADGSDRQVLASDRSYAWAHFSRGGQKIYLHHRDRKDEEAGYTYEYDLVVLNGDGFDPITLVNKANGLSVSWTGDGRALVLSVKRGDSYSLYRTNSDGSGQVTLDSGQDHSYLPRLSDDGQWLCYEKRNGDIRSLYLSRSDGSQPAQLFSGYYNAWPTWASSGDRLLVRVRETQEDPYDLYIVDTASGQQLRLVRGDSISGISFSPDEAWIAAEVRQEDFYRLYLISADGAQQREIVGPGEGADWQAIGYFSPDGERLLVRLGYKDTRDTDLYLMNVDGGQRVTLAQNADWAATGAFTSDGRLFVFDSNRDGGRAVYVAQADGSAPRKLVEGYGPVIAAGQPARMYVPRPLPRPTFTPTPAPESSG